MKIIPADVRAELPTIRSLWTEYIYWVASELDDRYGILETLKRHMGNVDQVIERNLSELPKFSPPEGRLVLAHVADHPVGIGCFHRISSEIAELKRMYVRPAARGNGVGRAVLESLLYAARETGYRTMRLESAAFMKAAHSLYHSVGFVDIDPYVETEIPADVWPYWVFMERALV